MKKILSLAFLLVLSFSLFSTTASAKANEADLAALKALSTKVSKEVKTYDSNSIKLLDSVTFPAKVKDKEGKPKDVNVKALYASYELSYDTIFAKTHKEVYFYDENNETFLDPTATNTILTEVDVAKDFKQQYKDEVGTHVHTIGPSILLILLGIWLFLVIRFTDKGQ
ncbi:MAG: hypothetical protein ACI35O_01400 [Bacillaceae bacterium]